MRCRVNQCWATVRQIFFVDQLEMRTVALPFNSRGKWGTAMSAGDAALIGAAIIWAYAMEAMAEAEKNQRVGSRDIDEFESAELALYEAVVAWRAGRH